MFVCAVQHVLDLLFRQHGHNEQHAACAGGPCLKDLYRVDKKVLSHDRHGGMRDSADDLFQMCKLTGKLCRLSQD